MSSIKSMRTADIILQTQYRNYIGCGLIGSVEFGSVMIAYVAIHFGNENIDSGEIASLLILYD